MGVGICFVDYRLILLLVAFGILFLACFFLLRELEAYEKIEKYSNKYGEQRLLLIAAVLSRRRPFLSTKWDQSGPGRIRASISMCFMPMVSKTTPHP